MKRTVISLGGSVIVPDRIDIGYLSEFKECILKYARKNHSFLIVTGGGKTARSYKEAACEVGEISEVDRHLIGVQSTRLNAELLRSIFGSAAYEQVFIDYNRKVQTDEKVLVAGGFKPGTTTDFEAVNWAKNLNVKRIINLTDVDYVYSKDPRRYRDAKKIVKISWKDFIKLLPEDNLGGGGHFPFDTCASRMAMNLGIEVLIVNKNIKNLERCIEGREFRGTTIR